MNFFFEVDRKDIKVACGRWLPKMFSWKKFFLRPQVDLKTASNWQDSAQKLPLHNNTYCHDLFGPPNPFIWPWCSCQRNGGIPCFQWQTTIFIKHTNIKLFLSKLPRWKILCPNQIFTISVHWMWQFIHLF